MSVSSMVALYLSANLVLIVGFAVLLATILILGECRRSFSARVELRLQYFVLLSVLAAVGLQPLFPKRDLLRPIAKVWAASSRRTFVGQAASARSGYWALSSHSEKMVTVDQVEEAGWVLAGLVFGFGGLIFFFDLRRLLRLRARAYSLRSLNGFKLYLSDEVRVPFSFWLPGQMCVVMPQEMVGTEGFRIAVLHEIQHHRQLDTKWVYLIWALRMVFVLNPIVHLWSRWIAEVQELACDEALLTGHRVEARAYARCLVQVAESALLTGCQPICASGLMFWMGRQTLKRRITAMFQQKKNRLGWRPALAIVALATVVLGVTSYASQGLVQDRRLGLTQAKVLARGLNKDGFPVVVNRRVVQWLNYFVGTPDGRDQVKSALNRMGEYQKVMQEKFNQYRAPQELFALPLIESGYRNLKEDRNSMRSAGVWQFIPSTARVLGLRVDAKVDQRLDVPVESDAALRLLLSDRLRFDDWQLAILAYNAGERTIESAIHQTGSRDAWVLIRSGLLSHESENYLPKFMAMLLVMKNPRILD